MQRLLNALLGSRAKSKAGRLDRSDLWSSGRDVLIGAVAVGFIAGLEAIDKLDFGKYEGIATAVIMFVLVALRRAAKDYNTPEGPPAL